MMTQSASTWLYKGHKLVVMGHINLKEHALIKRRWACKKMNAMGRKFKHEKNKVIIESNLRLLLKVVCVFEVLEFTTT
jgi:hypothetical protein